MITYSVKVTTEKIPALKFSPAQLKKITDTAISTLVNRVQNKHTDANDAPMPEYSNKPIYVRVGRGFQNKLVLQSNAKYRHQRVPLTTVAALRSSGVRIINLKGNVNLRGRFKNSVVKTGNSIRFPNRAAYKRYLGKSGLRDLTETGAMLAALGVISQSGGYAKVIVIGMKSSLQDRKARGNARITDWMGLSPSDQVKVVRVINDICAKNLKLPEQYGNTPSTVSF